MSVNLDEVERLSRMINAEPNKYIRKKLESHLGHLLDQQRSHARLTAFIAYPVLAFLYVTAVVTTVGVVLNMAGRLSLAPGPTYLLWTAFVGSSVWAARRVIHSRFPSGEDPPKLPDLTKNESPALPESE